MILVAPDQVGRKAYAMHQALSCPYIGWATISSVLFRWN